MHYDSLITLRNNLDDSLRRVDVLLRELDNKIVDPATIPPEARMEYIAGVICDYGNISKKQLIRAGQKGDLVMWRRIACYVLTEYASYTLVVVRDYLEYESAATVLSHRNKMRVWMAEPQFAPRGLYLATKNILVQLGYEKKPRISDM